MFGCEMHNEVVHLRVETVLRLHALSLVAQVLTVRKVCRSASSCGYTI